MAKEPSDGSTLLTESFVERVRNALLVEAGIGEYVPDSLDNPATTPPFWFIRKTDLDFIEKLIGTGGERAPGHGDWYRTPLAYGHELFGGLLQRYGPRAQAWPGQPVFVIASDAVVPFKAVFSGTAIRLQRHTYEESRPTTPVERNAALALIKFVRRNALAVPEETPFGSVPVLKAIEAIYMENAAHYEDSVAWKVGLESTGEFVSRRLVAAVSVDRAAQLGLANPGPSFVEQQLAFGLQGQKYAPLRVALQEALAQPFDRSVGLDGLP